MSVTAPPTTRRRRSARGEGERLREEILVATAALLARMGSDEALSLRAVAREVGVSAPSVYLHFPDKEALLLAVAAELFSEVERALDAAAAEAGDDPVATVVARARAYVEWGLEHPGQYKVLYEGALWRRLDHPQQQRCSGRQRCSRWQRTCSGLRPVARSPPTPTPGTSRRCYGRPPMA